MLMNKDLVTLQQIMDLMSRTIQELNLDIDLSDFITKNDIAALCSEFETKLAIKVDKETFNSMVSDLRDLISDLESDLSDIINPLPIDLSAESDVKGILGIVNGGTGATTERAAQYNLLNDLNDKNADLQDSDYLIYNILDQSEENGSIGKIQASNVFNWVKSRIEKEETLIDKVIPNETIDTIFQ